MPLLEATDLHERVRAAVEQHRDEVAELVNAEVDRLVEQLVADRIAAGNGHPKHTIETLARDVELGEGDGVKRADRNVSGEPDATKRCTRCKRAKPLSEFRRHRGTCRNCRRKQDRERNAARRQASEEAAAGPLESGAGSTSAGSAAGEVASPPPSTT